MKNLGVFATKNELGKINNLIDKTKGHGYFKMGEVVPRLVCDAVAVTMHGLPVILPDHYSIDLKTGEFIQFDAGEESVHSEKYIAKKAREAYERGLV